MKIRDVTPLKMPGIQVIRFERFIDKRGYFTETFRQEQLAPVLWGSVEQMNESFSLKGAVRGLHFQWNPHMGKLVRTLSGNMVDLFLDIRMKSETFGKIGAYGMPMTSREFPSEEWIWVPPGFAHGNFFEADTHIQYACTGKYSQGNEACISPLAPDIDWSLCPAAFVDRFKAALESPDLKITDKDRDGLTVAQWRSDPRAENFQPWNLPVRG